MPRSSKIANPAIRNNKTKKRNPDFLSHIVFGSKATDILKILKDGFLRSSKETKNVKLFGWAEGSEYIYLQLNNKGPHLEIDIKALDPAVNPAYCYFNFAFCSLLLAGKPAREKGGALDYALDYNRHPARNQDRKIGAQANRLA